MDRIVKDFTVTNSYQVIDMNKTDRYVLYGIGKRKQYVEKIFLNMLIILHGHLNTIKLLTENLWRNMKRNSNFYIIS